MKKLLFLLLTVVLAISLFIIPANAAGATTTITISAEKTEVTPGDGEIIYNVKIGSIPDGIKSVTFTIEFPSELGDPISAEIPSGTKSMFPGVLNQDTRYDQSKHYYFAGADTVADGTKSGQITLLTVKFAVTETTVVNKELEPTINTSGDDFTVFDGNMDEVTATVNSDDAGVTVKHIDDTDHHWQAGEVTKATCKEPMSTHYTCTTCQATKDVPEGDALGHDFGGTTFNWDGTTADTASVTVTVKCAHEGCVYHNNTAPSSVELTTSSEPKPGSTCGQKGKVIWTAKGTVDGVEISDTYEVDTDTVMHKWGDVTVTWDPKEGKPTKATATRKCELCGATATAEDTSLDETVSAAATCTKTGTATYKAGFEFKDNFTSEEQKTVEKISDPITLPALGHEWPEKVTFTWTGESDKVEGATATAKVNCQRPNCDAEEFKTEMDYEAKITKDVKKAPSCEDGGSVTYTATLDSSMLPGLKTPYTEDKTEELGALGHDFGENDSNKAEFTWPEKAGDKNTEEPNDVTATLYCEREKENITADSVDVVAGNKVAGGKTEPTYEKDGTYYWTATAKFSNGKGGTVYKKDENHEYTVPKLEATVSEPTLATEADPSAKNALEADVKNMLDAALTENSFSGMDADLEDALRAAQASTTAGMNVTTALVVTDSTANTGTVPGVDAENVKGYYDIHIDVTVQLGSDTKTGHITEVSTPITFTIKLPSGGPIWYVMTNHGGTWAKIEGSKVENGHIVFSSKQFSDFAIISSNDLKDAKIEAIPAQTYTGKAITPKVKVTINGGQELTENEDYTVTYSNNTDKGTATVTIKPVEDEEGNSTFIGSNTATFQIKAAPSGGSGSGSGNGSGSGSPETGDETPLALYAAVLTASLAALAATLLVLRKQRQK